MATVYSTYSDTWKPSGSSVYKKYRARLDYSTSYNATTFSCTAITYFNLNSTVTVESASGKMWATNGKTYTGTCSTTFNGATTVTAVSSHTYSWERTTTAQTKYVYGSVMSSKQDWDGKWMTATATITIPALDSYAVTYNSNPPVTGTVSNMPSSQTKYYGINLTLSTTTPTFTNYVFTGWNTASDGTGTSYASGATYSGNTAVTLYAQWTKQFILPTVENITLQRVETSSSTTADDEGSYLLVTLTNYSSGRVPADSTPTKTTSVSITATVNGTAKTLTLSGGTNSFSGTGTTKRIWYAVPTSGSGTIYPTTDSYPLTITFATSGYSSATYTTTLASSIYPIDVAADASLMAFGVPIRAKDEIYIDVAYPAVSGSTDYQIYTALNSRGWWNQVYSNGQIDFKLVLAKLLAS